MTEAPLSPAQLQVLKRQLLKKGAEINAKLTELLANPTMEPPELPGQGRPGEKPIERLRRFMALIDGRLRALREGRYGRCERCGADLPFAHLSQVPWIDTCQRCAQAPPDDEANAGT